MSSAAIYVRRRFLVLFLPIVAFGALLFLVASAATLTVNGGSILGWGIAGFGLIAAAWDSGDRR